MSRLEVELRAEYVLQVHVARVAVLDLQDALEFIAVVVLGRVVDRLGDQAAAAGDQLAREGVDHPVAPVTVRHQRDAAAMPVLQDAACDLLRLLLGRERELVQAGRSGAARRQEIERQHRDRLRPDGRGGADCPSVVHVQGRSGCRRQLVIRAQKAVAHRGRLARGRTAQRQQQRDAPTGARRDQGRRECLGQDFERRVVRIFGAPAGRFRLPDERSAGRIAGNGAQLEPAAHDGIRAGRGFQLDAMLACVA